jgi:superfamily II DNA helicase RecQ
MIGQAPIIALTATATQKVREDIKKILGMPDAKEFKSSFNRPNLYYEVRPKTKNVDKSMFKKTGEELQQYLHFRKRGGVKPNGKGYDRKKMKKARDGE